MVVLARIDKKRLESMLLALGVFLFVWPILAAFLSGLLFGSSGLGTWIARCCYFAATMFGNPSMIAGSVFMAFFTFRRWQNAKKAN